MIPGAVTILALLLLGSTGVHADELDEILDRHVEARGGLEAIDAIHSIHMSGSLTAGPRLEFPFVIDRVRPNLRRLDIIQRGTTTVRAFDGEIAWGILPTIGIAEPQRLPAREERALAASADFDGSLIRPGTKGVTLELLEPAEGDSLIRIRATNAADEVETFGLDPETYLVTEVTGRRTLTGGTISYVTSFEDYRELEGVLYSHRWVIVVDNGAAPQVFQVESTEVNTEIDPTRFVLPEPGNP